MERTSDTEWQIMLALTGLFKDCYKLQSMEFVERPIAEQWEMCFKHVHSCETCVTYLVTQRMKGHLS